MTRLTPLRIALLLGLLASPVAAQSSASWSLGEQDFNCGGDPKNGVPLASASWLVRLDALGDTFPSPPLSSASYRIDGGFVPFFPPPGEVANLRLDKLRGGTLTWNPELSVGSYAVYRGLASALPALGYGSCFGSGFVVETTFDASLPPAGETWFYLVTARNRVGEEGVKGYDSGGTPMPNPSPCP